MTTTTQIAGAKMNELEQESLEWLDKLCAPDMYGDRLGAVRDWVKRALLASKPAAAAVTLTEQQFDAMRVALEVIAVGDSKTPSDTAAHGLVAAGFWTAELESQNATAPAQPCGEDAVCSTCNGHGMIGGPSYYSPDEGGEPCPDCNAPQIGEDAANGAIGEREAFDQWFKTRGVWPRLTYLEVWQASRAALTAENPYADVIAHLRAGGVVKLLSHDEATADADAFRAALTAEKVAGQEPVGEVTATALEGADQGVVGWYGDPLPVNSLLYAAPQQPAQSAEQDERAAYSVEDWFRDLAGDRPISHVLQEMTHAEVAVRAFSAGRAASTQSAATQPAVGWFVQRSEFGPWVEVEHQEPGAEQFYRIAPQPVQPQVALTLTLDQLVAVRAAANLAESMGTVVISTDLRSILLAAQPSSGGEA